MPNVQPVTRERHSARRWERYSSYRFAALDAVAPLVAEELPKALIALPIGFVRSTEGFVPAAVQGLQPGRNLFVAADGRWLTGYVPAHYRGHPFCLASTDGGQQVLCVDEDSGLVSDGPSGERFFEEDGKPSQAVTGVLNFLLRVQANRDATLRICAALQKQGLIQPWSVRLQTQEGDQMIEGLYRIDEAALNALPAEAFIELRSAAALPVAYCQLLSMQHLSALGRLAEAHAMAAQPLPTTPSGDLDLEFLNRSGLIGFGSG